MKKIFLIVLVISMLISGCDSRQEMRDRFGDGKHVMMTDNQGTKYIISHHIGSTYSVEKFE